MTKVNVQIIKDAKGSPAFAVVPWAEYRRLASAIAEDAEDAALLERGLAGPDRFPVEVVERITSGENVLKVFREWRGLTQAELAKRTGRATMYISQLETGNRPIGSKTARVLAPALDISPEALID
jgi:DNA-binding XRE family transcriptional regulator